MNDQQFRELYDRHVGMVYRVCYAYMKSPSPTEDAVQETFIRALTRAPRFESSSHERGWLVRTATNICKDTVKTWWRSKVTLDMTADTVDTPTDSLLGAVMSLPDKYKTVIYLYYYEGYTSAEIAQALGQRASTVRNHLSEARKLLRQQLGGEFDEE